MVAAVVLGRRGRVVRLVDGGRVAVPAVHGHEVVAQRQRRRQQEEEQHLHGR